jgi:hypothetical protein
MKGFAIPLALAAIVSSAPLGAQIVSRATSANRRADCRYVQTTNSIGDIIYGRSGTALCSDNNSRVDNAWYQIGTDRNGNAIYERRRRGANGRLIIERSRRDASGNFVIVATRPFGQNKADTKAWKRAEKAEDKQMKTQLSKGDYKTFKKTDKEEDKADKAAVKNADKAQKEAWKGTKVKGKDK